MTVSELGEHALLARIRARLVTSAGLPEGLVLGIGDDAAVVRPGRNALTVLTVDAQVEGVHFDRALSAPTDIGARALAVNLSDLAAMGARPRWALVSLMVPGTLSVADAEGLIDGVAEEARRHGVTVVGGNISRSPGPLVIDVTAVGEVRPRRVLSRSGGRPGDELYVSGSIGGAAAGLAMLRAGQNGIEGRADCVRRYRRPEARVRLGWSVGQARAARAAMDLSDGLADAAHQVAEASGCGVEIDAGALPIAAGARAWWAARGEDAIVAALTGGDDYELLLAVPPSWRGRLRTVRERVADPPLTRVGVLTKDPGARLLNRDGQQERLPGGFEHF